MIEPRSAFAKESTICLHYLEWDPASLSSVQQTNADELPIVMLHGLGATAHTWRLVAQHLHAEHLLVAFDLRGHGQSERPNEGYDLAMVGEDVVQAMASLGFGQVALVGHGWGARVALVLAAQHPALISHLVLVDCPHVEMRYWPGMTRERFIRETSPREIYNSRQAFLDAMRHDMQSFWSADIEAILQTYIYDLGDEQVGELLRPQHQRLIREALWEDRALTYYSKLRCPVLLVPAAQPPSDGKELPERLENASEFAAAKGYMAQQVAEIIQHCSVLWMPDTSHDIQLQRPAALASAILQFIERSTL